METKICRICGRELPLDKFKKAKSNGDKLRSECRECSSEMTRQWRIRNKGRVTNYRKEYNESHQDEISKQSKKYREEHKDKITKNNLEYKKNHKEDAKKYMEQYRKDNKKKLSNYSKQYSKQYFLKNKEIMLKKQKEYYLKHYEQCSAQKKQYREANKEIISARRKALYIKNYQADKERISVSSSKWKKNNRDKCNISQNRRRRKYMALPHNLSARQWDKCKDYFDNRCAYCGKELPLTMEHFVANKNGGEYTVNNIIPACKSCNCSKQDKDFFEWYPKYRYYSKKREKKILKYLNYKEDTQQLKII